MKLIKLFLFLMLATASASRAAESYRTVMVDSNGVVKVPNNFITANGIGTASNAPTATLATNAMNATNLFGTIAESQVTSLVADLSGKAGTNETRSLIHTNPANQFRGTYAGDGTALSTSWTNLSDIPAGFADGTDDGSGGSLSAGDWATLTNRLVRVWNVRDYGAIGGSIPADSVGFAHAFSNLFRYGGRVYAPGSGTAPYIVTNHFAVPALSTNSGSGTHVDMAFIGDGMGASIVKLALTNQTFLDCDATPPLLMNLTFINVGSGTNSIARNTNTSFGTVIHSVQMIGFTNSAGIDASHPPCEAFNLVAQMGTTVENIDVVNCDIGVRMMRYMDGCNVYGRFTGCNVAPVVLGGYPWRYPEAANANIAHVKLNGSLSAYGTIVAGSSRGVVVSGYQERQRRANVAFGYPLDLFPGETNTTIGQAVVRDLNANVNYTTTNALIELNTSVGELTVENVYGARLLYVTNSAAATGTHLNMKNISCQGSFVEFNTAGNTIPSLPGADINVNRDQYYYYYNGTVTNLNLWVNNAGIAVRGQARINSTETAFVVPIQQSSAGESWMIVGGSTNGAGVTKNFRLGMFPWDGSTDPQTIFSASPSGAGAASLSIGGGTSLGKPFSLLDLYAGADPSTANAGTNLLRLNAGGVAVQAGASVFHSLAGSNYFANSINPIGLATNNPVTYNGGFLKSTNSGTQAAWTFDINGHTNLNGADPNTFANSTLALSTVYASTVRFATNQASDFQIDFDKKRSLLATNNAVTFSSCLNVPSGTLTTNVASCMVTLTNTAGSANPKLITMATPFQNMNASQGNTIYITNLLKIVVSWQLGEGTNFWWVGR